MCRSVVCRCKSVKSVCRRRAAAPALFLKSLGYFRDPNGKTNQQSLQWVPSISSIMTPCRTEKVDFSKKIKKKKKQNHQKNKIDRKNHQKKQKKQEKKQNLHFPQFLFFLFVFVLFLFFLFLSCFFLGFGFLVCFFCLLWFCFCFFVFYFFCQTLYSLCCWTHNSSNERRIHQWHAWHLA